MNHKFSELLAKLESTPEGREALAKARAELERERLVGLPEMALRNDRDNKLDDVVVKNVRMFRAEMMDEGSLWMACYFDEVDIHFWVRADGDVLLFDATDVPEYKDIDDK